MKKGAKRIFVTLMLAAVPLAYSAPISLFQETIPKAIKKMTPAAAKLNFPNLKKRLPQAGVASWYSQTDPGINRHTANGEIFDDKKMTCATWHHPFGTLLEVKNLSNGKSVVCRVNDRGPAKRLNRVIDLTISAFRKIAEPRRGLVRVSVTPLPAK